MRSFCLRISFLGLTFVSDSLPQLLGVFGLLFILLVVVYVDIAEVGMSVLCAMQRSFERTSSRRTNHLFFHCQEARETFHMPCLENPLEGFCNSCHPRSSRPVEPAHLHSRSKERRMYMQRCCRGWGAP